MSNGNHQLVNEKIHGKPIDAATVVLLRDTNNSIETLLLCRGRSKTVMNNAWVFPGGKVDAADHENIKHPLAASAVSMLNEPELSVSLAGALFSAACRETQEETGVQLEPANLYTWSRWITPDEPSMMKKRFDARFFVTRMPDDQHAMHDGSEATDSQWLTPQQALTAYQQNKMVLAPPQIMTLLALTRWRTVAQCLAHAQDTPAYTIKPEVIKDADSRILTYPGDTHHSDPLKQMPGPTRLSWNQNYFEPPQGFQAYFD